MIHDARSRNHWNEAGSAARLAIENERLGRGACAARRTAPLARTHHRTRASQTCRPGATSMTARAAALAYRSTCGLRGRSRGRWDRLAGKLLATAVDETRGARGTARIGARHLPGHLAESGLPRRSRRSPTKRHSSRAPATARFDAPVEGGALRRSSRGDRRCRQERSDLGRVGVEAAPFAWRTMEPRSSKLVHVADRIGALGGETRRPQ